MSTTTGKTLNLVKPELTDDHKVTIGTDLPANFQKIDDEFSAHKADTAYYENYAKSAAQSIPDSTNTEITFATRSYSGTDRGMASIDGSNHLVIAKAGVYEIEVTGLGFASGSGGRSLSIAGATVLQVPAASGIGTVLSSSKTISVTTDNYSLPFAVYQNSGGALDVSAITVRIKKL